MTNKIVLATCKIHSFTEYHKKVMTVEPNQNYPPYFSQFYVFIIFSQDFQYAFFAYQVSSTIDACHIFKSSYDETINKLLVSSYELLNICQASIIDFTLLCNNTSQRSSRFNTLLGDSKTMSKLVKKKRIERITSKTCVQWS